MPDARFLVVFDADSTLIRNEVIELIADEAGRGAEVAAATEAAMRGEVDFATSLRSRVQALRGVPVTAFSRVLARIEPTAGARELIDAIHARGGIAAVVSGGFHEILDTVAPELGADVWRANRLAVADGSLTGVVDGPIVDAAGKAAALREWATAYGVPDGRTIAVGDGANDLPMLGLAGLGVAFRAKPLVKQSAKQAISTLGLDGILYLLGYRDREGRA